jgi:hypothetical protein
MSDHKAVPERDAVPIIDALFDAANAAVAPRSAADLSLEERERVAREVAEKYNLDQKRYDADVRVMRGECPCGNCEGVGFRITYRTYH